MKGFLILCLIFTLSLAYNHPMTAARRDPQANPTSPDIQSWCSETPNPEACVTTIQSDPRNDLKSTLKGVAMIMVDAAKANVESTKTFIRDNVKSEKEEDVLGKLYGCLVGYNAIKSDLNFDPYVLDLPEGRGNATETLDRIVGELMFNCGWEMLQHYTPVVQQLDDMVNRFSEFVVAAGMFLSWIPGREITL